MKKLIAILAIFTMTAGLFMPVSSARLCGDINGDGEINSLDIISMIMHLNGSRKLTGEDFITANTYTYGETFAKVDSQDLVALIQYVFKQIKTLPVDSEPVTTTRATTTTTMTTTTARTTTTSKAIVPTGGLDPYIYKDYAIEYGQSVGLEYTPKMNDRTSKGGEDNPLKNCSWNPPINLYTGRTDEQMRRSVRTVCDDLKYNGHEYFRVEVYSEEYLHSIFPSELAWQNSRKDLYQLFIFYR